MFMRVVKLILLVALIGAVLGAVALENRLHHLTHDPLPPEHGRFQLAGLTTPVRVFRDEVGAPHIHAETDEDAFFTMGYVVAQERLFQMDLMRRLAQGRLAEIFGPAALPADKLARVVGFMRTAEEALPHVGDEARRLAQAYAAGVNAAMDEMGQALPLEFRALDYAPEPWTLLDSYAIARLQAWQLSANYQRELLGMAVAAERGQDSVGLLLPGLEAWGPYILNPEQRDYTITAPTLEPAPAPASAQAAAATATPGLRPLALALLKNGALAGFGQDLGLASNNWVVSGSKTRSGKPIMCNDPHLALPMPPVWIELHLKSPTFDVTGVAFPGVPAVVLGHNRYVAWGATTTLADTQDLYIERPYPADPERMYVVPGGAKRYRVVIERILVKGGGPHGATRYVEVPVRISRHGPVINDLVDGLPADSPPLALRWAGHEPSDDLTAILAMSRATNWPEFKAGLDQMGAPIQNWVFASIGGDIAYVCAGLIPVRKPGHNPSVPVPGETDDFEWLGWIPRDELPQVVNPPAGFVASANNKVVPSSYPYYVQDFAAAPYRAARIQELLADASTLTMDDMARIQLDDYMVQGRRMAPHIIRAVRAAGGATAVEADALAALEGWDYHAAVDSVGSTVFHAVMEKLIDAVLEDELSPELYARAFSGPNRILGVQGLLDRMCNEAYAAVLWDDRRTEAIETPDTVLAAAFRDAVAELASHHGDATGEWAWGAVHQQQFFHMFSEVPPWASVTARDTAAKGLATRLRFALADSFLGAGPFPLPGSTTTVRASPYRYVNGMFDPVWGVSFRHIVDMADVAAARGVITAGNSGHMASPHYRDQVDLWRSGRYHAMPMDIDADALPSHETVVFVPLPGGRQAS